MNQLDATPPTAATAATVSNMNSGRPATALPSAFGGSASSSNFSSTFRQVQSEVANFISHGDGVSSAPAAPSQGLSVEALALRARAAAGGAGSGAIDPDAAGADAELQKQFLASIQPWAEEAGQRLGVAPNIVAAHAALESAWGQRPLRGANGTDSNNLFGIKAGGQWQGEVAAATTTEYAHGAALKKVERFRSYPDTASAFRDYAEILSSNPRYQHALNTGSDAHAFASGLAQGGYATDPSYADKLAKLATQLQRSGTSGSAAAAKSASQSGE